MADAGDPNSKVGYVFEIKDDASKALGRIESQYTRTVGALDDSMRKFPKVADSMSNFMDKAGKSTEEAGDKQPEAENKFNELRSALSDNALSLDDLGISWNKFIKIAGAVSIGAAIVGIVSFLKSAIEKTLEFRRAILELNEVYHMSGKETAVVSGAVFSLEKRFGQTRDQAVELTRSLLDLGFKPQRGFIDLAKATQEFSAATGIAASGAAKFADEAINVLRLNPQSIRSLGNSIKYVADQSRLSADELAGMLSVIDPLLLRSGKLSETARSDLAASLIGLAGALKDADVDANGLFNTISEIQLGKISDAGTKATSILSILTGKSADFYEELSRDDPAKLIDELANAAARLSTNTEVDRQQLVDLAEGFGISYNEILKLRNKALEGQGDFFQKAAIASKKAAAEEQALADKAAARQAKLDAVFDRIQKVFDRITLAIGGKLLNVIERKILPPTEKWLNALTSKDINEAINTTVEILEVIGGLIKFVFGTWIDVGQKWFKSSRDMIGAFSALIHGEPSKALDLLKDAFFGSLKGLKALFFDPFDRMTKDVFGTSISESFTMAIEAVEKLVTRFIKWLTRKLEFVKKFPGYDVFERGLSVLFGDDEETKKNIEEAREKEAEKNKARTKEAVEAESKALTIKAEQARMPDRMQVMAPTMENFLRQQVELLREVRDMFRGGSLGKSPESIRHAALRGNQ